MTWRLGIVDCNTPHVPDFTRRINHVEIDADQWVEGAKVVAAVPGAHPVFPERSPGYVPQMMQQLRAWGIETLERPEDLIGRVDAVLIEGNDSSLHLGRALPFVEAGVSLFVDKPLTTTTSDARTLVAAARKHGTLLTSASALRFALEVQDVKRRRDELGAIVGVDAHGPGTLHPRNPGLLYYGIHAVEMLYSLMGTGCRTVRCVWEPGVEVVVGRWSNGRLGTVRATRSGAGGFGFTAFCEKEVVPVAVDNRYYYRELLRAVIGMLDTKTWPLTPDELVEPIAFQEAALISSQRNGEEVRLAEL